MPYTPASSTNQAYFPTNPASSSTTRANSGSASNLTANFTRSTSDATSSSLARSSRSSVSSSSNAGVAAPPMESAITRLLVSTKALLQGLTEWSQGSASENDVSNIYVRLGNDFNVACTAFGREGISMNNLMHFPVDLRTCLEACLSDAPSPRALELYEPKVRQIIRSLLIGLQEKQAIHRDRETARREKESRERQREREAGRKDDNLNAPPPPSNSSKPQDAFSQVKSNGGASNQLPKSTGSSNSGSSFSGSTAVAGARRNSLTRSGSGQRQYTSTVFPSAGDPQRRPESRSRPTSASTEGSGTPNSSISSSSRFTPTAIALSDFPIQRSSSTTESTKTTTGSGFFSSIPYAGGPRPEINISAASAADRSSIIDVSEMASYGLASDTITYSGPRSPANSTFPPPPSRNNLSNSTDRAPSPSAPPLQPIPAVADSFKLELPTLTPFNPDIAVENDDATPTEEKGVIAAQQESLEALKSSDNLMRRASRRFSLLTQRSILGGGSGADGPRAASPNSSAGSAREVSKLGGGGTPERIGRTKGEFRERTPSKSGSTSANSSLMLPNSTSMSSITSRADTIIEEDDDEGSESELKKVEEVTIPTSRRKKHRSSGSFHDPVVVDSARSSYASAAESSGAKESSSRDTLTRLTANHSVDTSDSEARDFPMAIYLQIERNVKKVKLEELPTIASLRGLFLERFQYNPGLDDFPLIYLRDPVVGVQYELEDLSEVKQGSLLSLNIDSVEQVKQHIDTGLSNLATEMKALIRLTSTPPTFPRSPLLPAQSTVHSSNLVPPHPSSFPLPASPMPSPSIGSPSTFLSPSIASSSTLHVPNALISDNEEVKTLRQEVIDLQSVIDELRSQSKSAVVLAKVNASRGLLDNGRAQLEKETSKLIMKGDEVQDAIDLLKRDVASGKTTLSSLQHIFITKSLKEVNDERDKIVRWINEVQPSWKTMWSGELAIIVQEQQSLKSHEAMLNDLQLDLVEASRVFEVIQQVSKEQGGLNGGRASRPLREVVVSRSDSLNGTAGEGDFFQEVQGLNPEHRRLQAIAESERRREVKNANRSDELTDELEAFVSAGRLKQSGGIEEAERLRQIRSEATLKAMFAS